MQRTVLLTLALSFFPFASAHAGTLHCVDSRREECRYTCRMEGDSVWGCSHANGCAEVDHTGVILPIRGTKNGFLLAVSFGTLTCQLRGARWPNPIADETLARNRRIFRESNSR